MVNLPSFDFIRHDVFTYGYVQVAVQQSQKLGYYLRMYNEPKKLRTNNLLTQPQILLFFFVIQDEQLHLPMSKSYQSLVAFLDRIQDRERNFASLVIQQAHKGINGI